MSDLDYDAKLTDSERERLDVIVHFRPYPSDGARIAALWAAVERILQARLLDLAQRAEADRAAVERVTALLDEWGTAGSRYRTIRRLDEDLRAALDHECDSGWFDRTLCPEPCGAMHSYCDTCGKRDDPCPHDAWSDCTGASNCPEPWHEHGCYADTGQCSEPLDHHAGATAGPAPTSEVRDDKWDEDDYTDVAGNPDPPFDVPGNPWEQ